jgi:hypothetical protein
VAESALESSEAELASQDSSEATMKLNQFNWEEDDEWKGFPGPEEQYSEPPLVEMTPAPPPEPPLGGPPFVPDDEEMFQAHRTDAETRALRALEQGGLDMVAGFTRTPLKQALTQPTSKAEQLRQARMAEDAANFARSRELGVRQDRFNENLLRMMEMQRKEQAAGVDDPVAKAKLAYEIEMLKAKSAEELARIRARQAVDVAGIEGATREGVANIGANKAGETEAERTARLEEERKFKAAEADKDRATKLELESLKPKPALKVTGGGRGAAPKGGAKGAEGKAPKMTANQYAQWVQAKGFIPIIKDLGQKFKDLKLYEKSAIVEYKAMKDNPSLYKVMGGSRVAKYNAISGPFLTMLGDMMQVGVITDSDMKRYAAMIPEPGDSIDVANTKISELSKLLQAKVDAYRTAFNIDSFFKPGAKPEAAAGGGADAVKAKLIDWLAKNPKHPRRAEAEARLQKLGR